MRRVATVLAAMTLLVATGCSASEGPSDAPATSGGGATPTSEAERATGALTVFAAASLTDTFEQIGEDLEAENPGLTVTFNFAGSSALAQQIDDGAPADVFASASPTNMEQVGEAAIEPEVFAGNVLQIVVPKGNPGNVTGIADFANADLRIALCAEQVPCGAAAAKALQAAGVTAQPDTLEQDVRATLTKATLGEVDAALVYRTDVLSAGDDVEGIDFPEAEQAVNDYPIAVLADAPNAEAARVFVEYVLSDRGRAVLEAAGFRSP